MVLGRSSYHVNQTEGLCYSKNKVEGYYNNLTEKITRFGLPDDSIPVTRHDTGPEVYFSIAIFQYGLAAYDLWLINKDESMLNKFRNCVDWAIRNQQEDGSWITFATHNPDQPYSAMAQGEGCSLLVRAYVHTNDTKYLSAAKRAIEFMLKPKVKGGTAEYIGNSLLLYEFTYLPCVLNGWIFAAWGLWDYYKATDDREVSMVWKQTVNTIAASLSRFDNGYWSLYNLGGAITSPFYHNLHISQLNVLYELTGMEIFKTTSERWSKYRLSRLNRWRAFVKKAIQKLIEK